MVQFSHRQKQWVRAGVILVLVPAIVILALIWWNTPQPDPGQSTTESSIITPVSGRFPTSAVPKTDPEDNPVANTILIKDFSFRPNVVQVAMGTPIDIFNADAAEHSVSSDDSLFDTGILEQNERGSVTFDTPGTYSYHCRRHPTMVATIVVTP